jgi:uncharacterized protein
VSLKSSRYNVWAEVGGRSGVFNGMTGALTVMAREERHAVEEFVAGHGSGEDIAALLEELVRKRVIINEKHDELAALRQRYDETRWRSDALAYTVVTSLGCNFDCPYCFESKHPSLLKPEVADALAGVLEDSLPNISRLSVTWMGGEPLLGSPQLLDLSDRFISVCDANDKEYSASIITNGWYLTAEMARALDARRVRSAQVTIDGPPDIHDVNRPHRSGGPTFTRIVENIAEAADHIKIQVRINVDTDNAHRAEDLLVLLADAGLAGRVRVGLGKITDAVSNEASPLASYTKSCLTGPEFGSYELAFDAVAEAYGFGCPGGPKPVGTPCTAVRAGELVVGSDGEMWKCWDDIGDLSQAIGTISDYRTTNSRLQKWLEYHPADDPHCSTCIAMPVCMGGCAHHDFHTDDREARCGSFRHNHVGRVTELLRRSAGLDAGPVPDLPRFERTTRRVVSATPVTLSRRPVRL